MWFRQVRTIAVILVTLLGVGLIQAQERTWTKEHEKVEMEQLFGEYTYISTADNLSPHIERILYRDSEGVLLVIRGTTNFVSNEGQPMGLISSELSVTHVSSGEQMALTIHSNATITLVVGTAVAELPGQIPSSSGTKTQASSLLQANASQGFRDALARLGRVGAYYSRRLSFIGIPLRELFFPDIETKRITDYTEDPTEVSRPFNPNTNSPTAFDQQFGSAYYQ